MTTRDYMLENPEANLGWCKPYTSEDGKYVLILRDDKGKVDAIKTPDGTYYNVDLNSDILRKFAKSVNPDYDLYRGYTDEQLALEHMRETGCANCPFRDECEAMDAETES